MGQFTVVGHQDQAFAVQIEPAHGEQSRRIAGNQIHDARSPGGVVVGGNYPYRLVDRIVRAARLLEQFAIDADFLFVRINPRAKLAKHVAIDLDAAGQDKLLALPATPNARRRENLL
jgi:hypothetical protein